MAVVIRRSAVAEFLDRELDDFRWMKKLSRERLLEELNAFRVRPRFKGPDAWLHQLVCFLIGMSHPRFLFLLDMGAGKSRIISMLVEQRLREGRLDKALVTVPRLANIDSWVDDVPRYSNLEAVPIAIPDIEEKWERLIRARGDLTIIDIQGLQWAVCKKEKHRGKMQLVRDDKKIKKLLQTYNFLGLDEIHKLSSQETLWFNFLDPLSKGMDFCYGATGTLFGKHVERAFTPFYLVDRGETLGETLGLFRGAFFEQKPSPWKAYGDYVFRKDMHEELHRTLQHRSIRYEEEELTDLPPLTPVLKHFEMAAEQKEHYLRALEGLINAGGQLRELEATWLRMRQIVSGYLAWKDEHGDHVLRFKENPKLDGLEALLDEMGDSKAIVCYDYTETGRMIVERVQQMGLGVEWLYGGTKDRTALRHRFMHDNDCKVLVMNSEAGGTGNDGLQDVARYLLFYETPCDPTTRKQTEKRIHRPGQRRRSYIYDLIMKRSCDRGILDGIREGVNVHSAVVNGKNKSRGFFLGG